MHVIMAGTTVALGMAALGLSLRGTTRLPVEQLPEPGRIAQNLDYRSALRSENDAGMPLVREPYARVPSGRFWLLTSLAGLLTVLGGWWVAAHFADVYDPMELWKITISRDGMPRITRRIAHIAMGVTIVVLPLILSLVARFARGARMLLGIFALLLMISVAAQIWLGALLMLDSPIGTITRFNEPEPSAATADESDSTETTDTADAPAPRDAATRATAATSATTKPTTR
jgi:hypothetical protein